MNLYKQKRLGFISCFFVVDIFKAIKVEKGNMVPFGNVYRKEVRFLFFFFSKLNTQKDADRIMRKKSTYSFIKILCVY